MTYASISGRITAPGSDVGIRAWVIATPQTTGNALKFPTEDRIAWGSVISETADDGTLTPLKIPTNHGIPGLVWQILIKPVYKSDGPPWDAGYYEITADARLDDPGFLAITPTQVSGPPTDTMLAILAETQTARDQAQTAAASVQRGAANGVAPLDASTRLPEANLPTTAALVKEGPLSPYRYGFVGDNVADDTAALQATLNALPVDGGEINLPHSGNARITAPLTISKPTTLMGRSPRNQRIYANGCDAFHVDAGVTGVHLEGFELATDRYSDAANTLIGIKALGTDPARMNGHVYRNLFIDGFQTAMQVGYMWESTFDKVDTANGKYGLDVYGLSVNNTVRGCNLVVVTASGSRAARFTGAASPVAGSAAVAAEGWTFTGGTVLFGGETNLQLSGVRWFTVADCVIDYASGHGVLIEDNGTLWGGNHSIHDNYIAVTGGTACVRVLNQLENPGRSRNRIHHNELYGFGAGCQYGVLLDGAYSGSIVDHNTSHGMTLQDCNVGVGGGGSKVVGNEWLSTAPAQAMYVSALTEAYGNSGTFGAVTENLVYERGPNGRKTLTGTVAPTSGTWAVGDRKRNTTPAVGSPKGWICTAAGTPGTWVSEGNL